MKKIFTAIIAIFGTIAAAAAVAPSMADSAYNKEMYGDAADLYRQILAEQGPSADVYYNLGNALYRQDNVAGAVINYERALRIDPGHADARANLAFVNSRLEDKPENNNSFLTRLHHSVVTSTSADTWAWITLGAFLLLCGLIALYIFSGNVMLRKVGFFGGLVVLAATVYLVVVTVDAAKHFNDHSEAVVTVPSTLLNSAPRQPRQTEKVVPLHEGTKVEILDSVSTPDDPVSPRYYKISINGSAPAWLRATDVEII